MKSLFPFDNMTLHYESGSRHDFPRLARESGFSFNLYRGRVDWTKIGAIDVDKIVRERDLETLQDVLSSVMSCNLGSDYDLKVLDPNFIKIFQLAQLAADFLLYCRNYLDHCVTIMQEQLRVALQEIEQLRKLKQENAEEIIVLQKKLRAKTKLSRPSNSSPCTVFKCEGCGKSFGGEQYLFSHLQRRHPELAVSDQCISNQNIEVGKLQQQVHELQDRLRATEDALRLKQSSLIPDMTALQALLQNELQKIKPASATFITPTPTEVITPENLSPELKQPVTLERESPEISSKPPETNDKNEVVTQDNGLSLTATSSEQPKIQYENAQSALLVHLERQNDEIKALRDQLQEQHQMHELVMQRKLDELQSQHRADLDDLRLSITKTRGSGDHILVSSPTVNTMKDVTDSQQPSVNSGTFQAWSKPSSNLDDSNVAGVTSAAQVIKDSAVVEPSTAKISSFHMKPVRVREEYAPPTDQESSESSSHTSHTSSDVDSNHQVNADSKLEESHPVISSSSKKDESLDAPDHSKTMYGKVNTSSSGSSSETGSSLEDSDSQSSNSALQPLPRGNEGNKQNLQLTTQVLDGLKEDLVGLLNRRLQELGVDPEWEGLPSASFNSNMATVKHHENIASKSLDSYFGIQESVIQEVDKRVAEHLKLQQSTSNPSAEKKRRSGSFSIFARIKSHVKSKLSHAGPGPATKHSQKPVPKARAPIENVYSQEPSTSHSKVYSQEPSTSHSRSPHEYEVLHQKAIPPANAIEARTHVPDSEIDSSQSTDSADTPQPLISSPSTVQNENINKETNPISSGTNNKVKVYSRSMYANLSKSEIEVDRKESSSDSSGRKPAQLQTSTPIKPGSDAFPLPGLKKPTFMPSDVESISELDSDINEVIENTSAKPHPHTSLTTAELLANVAKFRQSTGANSTTQSVAKSNLKSSLSTGNINKKKVMFRDEKDGFNTIELGPAHSSYESLTPQRSHSETSLAVPCSSPPSNTHPVPQPRSSVVLATTHQTTLTAANTDSDGDWDYSSDNMTVQKSQGETSEKAGRLSSSVTKESAWSTNSMNEKRWSTGSTDMKKVSEIVKNLDRKLQEQRERPPFGVNIGGPQRPFNTTPGRFPMKSPLNSASSVAVKVNSSASVTDTLQEDMFSDLLLDDLSSS